MIPNRLRVGDTIGVCAPSDSVVGEKIEELDNAIEIMKRKGFKVEIGRNVYSTTFGYSATPQEKAEDLNYMFSNPNIKAVWQAKGGENSQGVLDYIDYELIKNNPKIYIGYSDALTVSNMITEKTGLVTFFGTNFKTIATDETDFSINDALSMLMNNNLELGSESDYRVIKPGIAEGELIGGNLFITSNLCCGKFHLDFSGKILCLEELFLESSPMMVSQRLYYLKQNGVFDKISGLWLGTYEEPSGIKLEKIVHDVIGDEYNFPIIQSDNFGHIEKKITIPIGAKARIDTRLDKVIRLLDNVVI